MAAIIIDGKSICKICGKTMNCGEELVAFPHFVVDENEPLYFFYDRGFHRQCFLNHPQKKTLIIRLIKNGYDEYKTFLESENSDGLSR